MGPVVGADPLGQPGVPLSEKERPKGDGPPIAQPQGGHWCRYHQAPVQSRRQGDGVPDHGEHVHAVFPGLQFLQPGAPL